MKNGGARTEWRQKIQALKWASASEQGRWVAGNSVLFVLAEAKESQECCSRCLKRESDANYGQNKTGNLYHVFSKA